MLYLEAILVLLKTLLERRETWSDNLQNDEVAQEFSCALSKGKWKNPGCFLQVLLMVYLFARYIQHGRRLWLLSPIGRGLV